MMKFFLLCILIFSFPLFTFAQEDSCPAITRIALESTESACETTGRNQACYGNGALEADFAEDTTFDQPGDIADVIKMQSLRLHPMDTEAGTWGVALMNLQANLPDTLPGQGVTFLLFGDVEMENADAASVTLEVTSTGNINMRSGPSTNYNVAGSLTNEEVVIADGRNETADWIHIRRENGETGWVYVPLMQTEDDDVNTLSVKEATAGQQAYYFRTGVGDAPCTEAPNSGILIQTPQGAGEIDLTLNDVNISLGSTAFLQAVPGGDMSINLLEGSARVQAFGEEQTAHGGMRIRVPVDENLSAAGPPAPPEMCEADDVQGLTISQIEVTCDSIHIDAFTYNAQTITIPFGMGILLGQGDNSFNSEAEANAGMAARTIQLLIDGQLLESIPDSFFHEGQQQWLYHELFDWEAPLPGTYNFVGNTGCCTFEVTIIVLEPPG